MVSQLKANMERHWKYLLFFLINQCIVPARYVHFDPLSNCQVRPLPSITTTATTTKKKYRSKSTKLNHWLREQQPKNCVKIRWADIIFCVVLLVIWDRKASNLPPSPPPFNPQSEKKMMKREDSEKAEISNNSSDKWKWSNDLLPVFFHSDNLHEARSSRMSKF